MTGEDARVCAMAALNLAQRLEAAGPTLPVGRDLWSEASPITILSEAIEGARHAYLRMLALAVVLEREERS